MEASLQDLLASEFFSSSKILAGEKGLSNKVSLVTVLDSPDAPKYMKGGELVVTTAYSLLNNEEQQVKVIEELAAAKAAALGIKLRFFDNQLPEAIRCRATELGFPVISIQDDYAYTNIMDFIMNRIVCRETRKFRYVEEAQEEFLAQVGQGGLAAIAYALSKWTGRRVAIYYNYEYSEAPEQFLPEGFVKNSYYWQVRPLQRLDNHMVKDNTRQYSWHTDNLQWCWIGAEFRQDNKLKGYLWLWEDGRTFDRNDLLLFDFAYNTCQVETKRLATIQAERQRFRSQYLDDLISGRLPEFDKASKKARELGWELPKDAAVWVMMSCGPSVEEQEVLYTITEFFAQRSLSSLINAIYDNNFVLLVPGDIGSSARLLHEFSGEIKKNLQGAEFNLGIGRNYPCSDILKSYREAAYAAKVGPLTAKPGNVFKFRNMGYLRLLNAPGAWEELTRYTDDYLTPLMTYDRENGSDLVLTLYLFLHTGYNYRATGKALFLHPNSIRYRMQLIEKIINVKLKSEEERFNLTIAIKLAMLINRNSPLAIQINKVMSKVTWPETAENR